MCPFKDVFSLSWLTHLPRIAEDGEIYAQKKEGSRVGSEKGWVACPERHTGQNLEQKAPRKPMSRYREKTQRLFELGGCVEGERVDPE